MKHIILTQRYDYVEDYQEYRDALDCRWYDLLWEMNMLSFPLPNHKESMNVIIGDSSIDGVIITGGGKLKECGGEMSKRESIEKELLRYCMNKQIPVIGVCYGMQLIADFFGAKLYKSDNHIRVSHNINGEIGSRKVNSFHKFVLKTPPEAFEVIARADDNTIEIFRHETMPILGMMYHPERESVFHLQDINMIQEIINCKG